MVFWSYYDSVYRLFATLGELYGAGKKRMEEVGAQSTESADFKSEGKTVNINEIEDDKAEDSIQVYFDGDVYDIDLDQVKEIPPNRNPETYIENNKDEYLRHAYERYKSFVENDREYVGIFLHGGRVFGADKAIVKEGLNECLSYFIEKENYEAASDVRDLLEEMGTN